MSHETSSVTAAPCHLPQGGRQEDGLTVISVEALSGVVTEIMRPVMQAIGKMLENNTAALEQLSAAQAIQNDRLEALERQIRLQTPVTSKQAGYLSAAIRRRARELLDKRGIDDQKATVKLSGAIRKAVLARYGVAALREIPRHEYGVALDMIGMWHDALAVRDVSRGRVEMRTGDDRVDPSGRCAASSPEGR